MKTHNQTYNFHGRSIKNPFSCWKNEKQMRKTSDYEKTYS